MEPHTGPLKLEELTFGQLLLHSEHGVGKFMRVSSVSGKPGVSVNFAGGTQALFHDRDLEKIQMIHTEHGPCQPLLDRLGSRPQEWLRFVKGIKEGTIFGHAVVDLTPASSFEPGQLLLHKKHGVASYITSGKTGPTTTFVLEFAGGWRQEIEVNELSELQAIILDSSSGRQPKLDVYPKKNQEWERFMVSERARQKRSLGQQQAPQIQRIPLKESVRHEVWRRDAGRCVRCGSREKLEFDHIVPVIRGGSDTARNIELLCEACNRKKGATI